ncbi:Lipid A export ATP-binding/permease protein MsbA [Mycena venus]|uniref:Lipid A export ATP-binding/permease protein MsbA n=1 Tax=Mycena venus TaxID=2733690 RepID=A0A8H6Y880_9AGAR|nr:Lipid A export ATP-binding/permease protein MsbA [Mycena venus]
MGKVSSEDEVHSKLDDFSYTTLQLGVWRLLLHKDSDSGDLLGFEFSSIFSSLWATLTELYTGFPIVWRFVQEMYHLAPGLFPLLWTLRLSISLESTILLYASSRLLRSVEMAFSEGRPNVAAILQAVIIRVICIVVVSIMCWARDRIQPILRTRVRDHFEEYILREQLRLDLPTSNDKNNKLEVRAHGAFYNIECLGEVLEQSFQLISQIIFTMYQPSGGITLTGLSLVAPFLASQLQKSMWDRAYVAYASNIHYLRIRALRLFASKKYREELISANIKLWIVAEYRKAREELGDISDRHPANIDKYERTPAPEILSRLSTDLPMFYWAASIVMQPGNFSISSFAILQQHAEQLRSTIGGLIYAFSEFSECISSIREFYRLEKIENKVIDGVEVYPNSNCSTESGMGFEFRNVSFAYPGAKSKYNAIKNVSLKIPAGHLVVIVGHNGSGKSTLIKLMNRLYDVDAGEILVDGLPIKNYRLADLRNAQALLAQDHTLYPLSLAENIGLGNVEHINDIEMVLQAVDSGDASDVITKLKDGLQTMLDPVQTAEGNRLDKEKHTKLQSILENLEQKAEVSGGEKQRLVAARTFMRFLSGSIRFATADEPSSALDPKAEHRLFQRLRESRGGKTLIFVTHRFGHLTKHADLVICMRDGEVAESGTHRELMARGGEYAELYAIQAQAYEDI